MLMLMEAEEQNLVEKARAGDRGAFDGIFERYRLRLTAVLEQLD